MERIALVFSMFITCVSVGLAQPASSTPPSNLAIGENFPNGQPMSVSDVFPGMPLPDATKIIEPRGGNFRGVQRHKSLLNSEYPWLVRWGNQNRREYEFNSDINWSWFSEPEIGQELLAVRRSISFFKENQPNKENFIKSLMEKYGEPTQFLRNENGDPYRIRWNYINGEIKKLPPNDFCVVNVWLLPDIKKPFAGPNSFGSDGRKSSSDWLAEFYDIGLRSKNCGIVLNVDFCVGDDPKRASCINIDMVDLPRIARSLEIRNDALRIQKEKYDQRPFGASPRL